MLVFPTDPIMDQIYTNNGKSWIWDGIAWKAKSASQPSTDSTQVISSDTPPENPKANTLWFNTLENKLKIYQIDTETWEDTSKYENPPNVTRKKHFEGYLEFGKEDDCLPDDKTSMYFKNLILGFYLGFYEQLNQYNQNLWTLHDMFYERNVQGLIKNEDNPLAFTVKRSNPFSARYISSTLTGKRYMEIVIDNYRPENFPVEKRTYLYHNETLALNDYFLQQNNPQPLKSISFGLVKNNAWPSKIKTMISTIPLEFGESVADLTPVLITHYTTYLPYYAEVITKSRTEFSSDSINNTYENKEIQNQGYLSNSFNLSISMGSPIKNYTIYDGPENMVTQGGDYSDSGFYVTLKSKVLKIAVDFDNNKCFLGIGDTWMSNNSELEGFIGNPTPGTNNPALMDGKYSATMIEPGGANENLAPKIYRQYSDIEKDPLYPTLFLSPLLDDLNVSFRVREGTFEMSPPPGYTAWEDSETIENTKDYLEDFDLRPPSPGDHLLWNGTKWVPSPSIEVITTERSGYLQKFNCFKDVLFRANDGVVIKKSSLVLKDEVWTLYPGDENTPVGRIITYYSTDNSGNKKEYCYKFIRDKVTGEIINEEIINSFDPNFRPGIILSSHY